jgi:hypothetical protein
MQYLLILLYNKYYCINTVTTGAWVIKLNFNEMSAGSVASRITESYWLKALKSWVWAMMGFIRDLIDRVTMV